MKTNGTNVIGKCYAGAAGTMNGLKMVNANFKLDGKSAEAEKTIQIMTREIGNLTVRMLDGSRNVGPDIKERYEAILAARKVIDEAQSSKVKKYTVCPHCRKKTGAGMHYCGWCGELLEEMQPAAIVK